MELESLAVESWPWSTALPIPPKPERAFETLVLRGKSR